MFDKLNSLTIAHDSMEMISKVGKLYHPLLPDFCQLTGDKIKEPAVILLEPQLGFLPSNICVVDCSFAKTIKKLLKKEYEYTYSIEKSNPEVSIIDCSYSIKWVGFNAIPQLKLIEKGFASITLSDSPEDVFSNMCDIGVKGIVSVSKECKGLLTRAHCMDIFKWIVENKIQKSSLILN